MGETYSDPRARLQVKHRPQVRGSPICRDRARAPSRVESLRGWVKRFLIRGDQHANVWWWNPARMSWAKFAKELLPRGDVTVPAGQVVIDLFSKIRIRRTSFDARARLPGGERFSLVATLVSQPRPYSLERSCRLESTLSSTRYRRQPSQPGEARQFKQSDLRSMTICTPIRRRRLRSILRSRRRRPAGGCDA